MQSQHRHSLFIHAVWRRRFNRRSTSHVASCSHTWQYLTLARPPDTMGQSWSGVHAGTVRASHARRSRTVANKETALATSGEPSLDDFMAAINAEFGGAIVDASVYSGGDLVEKSELVGMPFVVTDFEISDSTDYTRSDGGVVRPVQFAVVRIRTINGDRCVFTDGGTGILPVLEEHRERTGQSGGLFAKAGLRRSDYNKTLADGSSTAATTYYFA